MFHCNGIDPFVTLMGNFNWGPILRNNIVSKQHACSISVSLVLFYLFCAGLSLNGMLSNNPAGTWRKMMSY